MPSSLNNFKPWLQKISLSFRAKLTDRWGSGRNPVPSPPAWSYRVAQLAGHVRGFLLHSSNTFEKGHLQSLDTGFDGPLICSSIPASCDSSQVYTGAVPWRDSKLVQLQKLLCKRAPAVQLTLKTYIPARNGGCEAWATLCVSAGPT